jgi:hypothetical protein
MQGRSGGQERQEAPESLTAHLRQSPFGHSGLIQRYEPGNLEPGPTGQDGRQLSLAVMGDRQGVTFAPLPFPKRGSEGQLQPLTGQLVESIEEVLLALFDLPPFHNYGKDQMVAPPAERAKGELVVPRKCLG